jgi:hypothetical protein
MSGWDRPWRDRIALYCAIALAASAALFVVLYVEPVPSVLLPVLTSGIPLLEQTRTEAVALRAAAFFLLTAFAFLGGFSVGILFVPSAIAMAIAVVQAWRYLAE